MSSKTLRQEGAQGSVGSEPLGEDPTPIPKPGHAAAGVPCRGISDRGGQRSAWLHVSAAPDMFQATAIYKESKAFHLVIPTGLSPKTLGFPACLTLKTHICPEFQVRGVNPVPPATGGCPCPGWGPRHKHPVSQTQRPTGGASISVACGRWAGGRVTVRRGAAGQA